MSYKSAATSGKLTFPCTECNFEAQSARQLSRHKAVTHTQNALKCVLCPFVTAYQTNLLRHRKDVHGICGSKGNKSCKFCGFVSEDNDTLIHHQIEVHQDILKSAQAKFAKELVSAGGDESIADFSANFESMSEELFNGKSSFSLSLPKKSRKKSKQNESHCVESALASSSSSNNNNNTNNNFCKSFVRGNGNNSQYSHNGHAPITPEDNDFEENDFWKTGFIDHYADQTLYFNHNQAPLVNLDIQPDSVATTSRSSTPKSQSSHGINLKDLPATRIRRQYTCTDCGFRTVNPREFLYHRRDGHGHKIKIVECPYCVYACQYVQKLQRHLLLVHKMQSLSMTASGETISNGDVENEEVLLRRKYKKAKHSYEGSSLLDNDISNGNFDLEDNFEDNQSLNDEDFEHMNNFEMNLNEYDNDNDDNEPNDKELLILGEKDDEIQSCNILECSICKIKFGDRLSAQKHFIRNHKHSDSKLLLHSEMNSQFNSSPMQMTTSQRKVFDNNKSVHSCNYCGYKTRWISELERHVRVHSKEKPFKCMFCDFKSKWKGDLNRHIQRYHSSEHSSIDIESDSTNNYVGDSLHSDNSPSSSGQRQSDEVNNNGTRGAVLIGDGSSDCYNQDCSMEADDGEFNGSVSMQENYDMENEDSIQSPNGISAKMYKCTHCDFTCSTASRFHVHFVQHLNTKPFQCSICGHRSNWEWDVTKHIKMKAQRDPNHEKARPVLIHDSGKRDYSKYNKFVVWVGQAEAEMANSDSNKIDFRAKRFRAELDPQENDDIDMMLTPEVCFEVDGEAECSNSYEPVSYNQLEVQSRDSISIRPVIKSAIVSRHRNSRNRFISCDQCNFKHQFARVLVAHMASHFGQKPYGCKHCSYETNWREVIMSHLSSEHSNVDRFEFDMRFRCLIDSNSVCKILSLKELAELDAESEPLSGVHVEPNHSRLIEPNIYEEKAVIRCQYCPFLTTNHKKMAIHCRFHNPSKGALKCKYCPYYVNNREKLMRHQKLHQKGNTNSICSTGLNSRVQPSSYSSVGYGLISCALCPFQTNNGQHLSEHMKIHDPNSLDYDNVYGNSLLEHSLHGRPLDQESVTQKEQHYDYGGDESNENSVSLIDVNNMKNGNGKKFSYVCPACPAAFKSPGDYKIHAVFHASNYQHACPYCSYRARNKPQLCKHLYVHTAEYIAKRANSYPDGTKHLVGSQEGHTNGQDISMLPPPMKKFKYGSQKALKTGRKHRTRIEFPMKPVKVKLNSEENGKQKIVFNNTDLMASQEFLETKEYLQRINSGIKNRCMYRCSACPAVFTKVNTLIYHTTLHETKAAFTCELCNYSTATEDNLSIHSLLHNLTESQAALGYNFNYNCHKCPAGFSKRTRLEKHLSLHGAKYNWKCDKCDYSVRYAATLVKHRALHLINPNFRAIESTGLADEEHDSSPDEPPIDKSKLPLKLNFNQMRNGIDNLETKIKTETSAKLAIDEELSQDNCDEEDIAAVDEEEEEEEEEDADGGDENDSFEGEPELIEDDEEEEEEEEDEQVESEMTLRNQLPIESQ